MNKEHQPMEEEEGNVPFSSYISNTGPTPAFATTYDGSFDPYPYASSSWTPATSAPSLSYYQVPIDAGRGYQDPTIFERRGYAPSNLDISCSDPTALSASQYTPPLTSFNAAMWSPDGSSGRGGVEGSMEYFASPMGTATLSIAGSTSASPMGPGQDWAANTTPMDTPYSIGSSGNLSMPDLYGPVRGESGMFIEESFDTASHRHVTEQKDQHTVARGQTGETGGAIVQPPPPQGSGPDSGERRKSSAASSRATLKKERKRKPSSGQDGQPPPVQGPKLRTAARRHGSETGHLPKPGESPEDQRARTSHNKVEKEYRNRLNREFELVINALPPNQAARGQSSRGKMSKADVIGTATATIQSLADEVVQLRERKRQLEENKKKKLKEAQPS